MYDVYTHRQAQSYTCVCVLGSVLHPCTAASLSCGPTRSSDTCTTSSVLTHLHILQGHTNALEVAMWFPAHPRTHSAWETINRGSIRGGLDVSTGHVCLPPVSREKDPLISPMSEHCCRFVLCCPLATYCPHKDAGWQAGIRPWGLSGRASSFCLTPSTCMLI